MTDRGLVKPEIARDPSAPGAPRPNAGPLPAMPAPEGSPSPLTHQDPVDSPHLNEEMQHGHRGGLSTRKD